MRDCALLISQWVYLPAIYQNPKLLHISFGKPKYFLILKVHIPLQLIANEPILQISKMISVKKYYLKSADIVNIYAELTDHQNL